jgi:hypothetical protein
MKELAEKLFGQIKESLSNAPAQIGAELKHQVGQGSHELAAALFNGSGFVMYPRGTGKDDLALQGPQHEEQLAKEGPEQQQNTGRSGMGM